MEKIDAVPGYKQTARWSLPSMWGQENRSAVPLPDSAELLQITISGCIKKIKLRRQIPPKILVVLGGILEMTAGMV